MIVIHLKNYGFTYRMYILNVYKLANVGYQDTLTLLAYDHVAPRFVTLPHHRLRCVVLSFAKRVTNSIICHSISS